MGSDCCLWCGLRLVTLVDEAGFSGVESVGWGLVVGRLLVVVDPEVGVSASAFAAGWGADVEASRSGPVVVESGSVVFLPGLVEFVVLPTAVSLGAAVLYDLVKRLVVTVRVSSPGGGGGREVEELEVVEFTGAGGDRVVVVRWRRVRS